MRARVLLYGASGYSGREIATHMAADVDLVLAGRDAERVRDVAEPLGIRWRQFALGDQNGVRAALSDVDVLLNAAGPFAETALPLAEACIATGTHYCDVGGEWPVFAALMELDAVARQAGIVLLPGLGLTIAASDCLLARATERWPDTVSLYLGVSQAHGVSRGSARTAARLFDKHVMLRRDGRLTPVPLGTLTRTFDFGDGVSEATAMSWADCVTGQFSTGVRDIEIYSQVRWWERAGYRGSALSASLTGSGMWRTASGVAAGAWPQQARNHVRREGSYTMVVEAADRWRRPRWMRLHTLDGYGATVLIAAEGLRRLSRGINSSGFQTPSRLFGSAFVEESGAGLFEPSRSPATERSGAGR